MVGWGFFRSSVPWQKMVKKDNSIEIFFCKCNEDCKCFLVYFFPSLALREHKYKQAIEYEETRKATSSSPTHCELNHKLFLRKNTIFSLHASEQFIFSV